MQDCGSIEVILGPMFSGKSSELLRKVRRYEHARKRCLVINYLHDNRYTQSDQMATHDKVTRKAIKTSLLTPLLAQCTDYDVVAVDEGQFYPDIVEFCETLASQDKIVLVSALDGTFERKPFGRILELVPLAEKVIKLRAICVNCGDDAPFTKRICENKEVELLGGAQLYKPICRVCYHSEGQEVPIPKRRLEEEQSTATVLPELPAQLAVQV